MKKDIERLDDEVLSNVVGGLEQVGVSAGEVLNIIQKFSTDKAFEAYIEPIFLTGHAKY